MEKSSMSLNTVFVDCETTGLDPESCAIIQLAAIRKDGTTFVKNLQPHPGAVIVDKALQVNGMTREQLLIFPTSDIVAKEFLEFLRPQAPKIILAGHNVIAFDVPFLKALYRRLNLLSEFESLIHFEYFASLALAMALNEAGIMQTQRGWLRLSDLTQALGVTNEKSHDAMGDIRATKHCYEKMLQLMKPNPVAQGSLV